MRDLLESAPVVEQSPGGGGERDMSGPEECICAPSQPGWCRADFLMSHCWANKDGREAVEWVKPVRCCPSNRGTGLWIDGDALHLNDASSSSATQQWQSM